jgi:hypothetical protein
MGDALAFRVLNGVHTRLRRHAGRRPAIAVRRNGEADVVVGGPGGYLMYYWATPRSRWNSAQITFTNQVVAMGPNALSKPAIAVRADGEADVVAAGPNNSLFYYWATPGSQWNSTMIAGAQTTIWDPAIAVRSDGEVDVGAAGTNFNLMYYWATPGSQWNSAQIARPTITS